MFILRRIYLFLCLGCRSVKNSNQQLMPLLLMVVDRFTSNPWHVFQEITFASWNTKSSRWSLYFCLIDISILDVWWIKRKNLKNKEARSVYTAITYRWICDIYLHIFKQRPWWMFNIQFILFLYLKLQTNNTFCRLLFFLTFLASSRFSISQRVTNKTNWFFYII